MSGVFDPDQFMQEEVSGANDTTYPTLPAGEYMGVIADVKVRQTEGKDGKSFYPADITWDLINVDPKVLADLGRDKATVRQSVFLDLSDSGGLDLGKGKNVQLGRLREALDLNTPGFSLRKLVGAGPAKLAVTLAPDRNGTPRNNVQSVGKAG
jgi:hypothetical protein